jgi:hypothetical protein
LLSFVEFALRLWSLMASVKFASDDAARAHFVTKTVVHRDMADPLALGGWGQLMLWDAGPALPPLQLGFDACA